MNKQKVIGRIDRQRITIEDQHPINKEPDFNDVIQVGKEYYVKINPADYEFCIKGLDDNLAEIAEMEGITIQAAILKLMNVAREFDNDPRLFALNDMRKRYH